jgi:ferredoxin
MAYRIKEDCCTLCSLCEMECQNGAISEGKSEFVIDPEKCTECVGNAPEPMCAKACPSTCPEPDPNRVESRDQLLQKWQKLHPGKTPASV